MSAPQYLDGLATIADRYDAFVLDVWGVLHDGVRPYPRVVPALERLKAAGKRTCLLSNAPMRADTVARRVDQIGVPRVLFGPVMSSGEEVWQELHRRTDPSLGDRCLWMGPARHLGMQAGLDLRFTDDAGTADFILNTGPDDLDDDATVLRPALTQAAERKLTMICANADLYVVHASARIVCAGRVAQIYEQMGGDVRWHGKPFPSVYRSCFKLLGDPDRSRVLAIGDSLRTDIAGAARAGIDSLMIASGIDAELFGPPPWPEHRLAEILGDGPRPTYIATGLAW